MRTVILDPPPAGFDELLARRQRWGGDRRDEIWDGELHMNPLPSFEHQIVAQQLALLLDPLARSAGLVALVQGFALGDKDDYRAPDGGLLRAGAGGAWQPTAALAIEIISPGDETWDKLPFYAAHGVDELLILDPATRSVQWFALRDGEYRPLDHSGLIDLTPAELTERIDWPA